jgi:phosphatidylglycerophosphate synthase
MTEPYRYNASVKSSLPDELINTYLLRPIAGLLVRVLYPTRVTPNQVTIAAIIIGLLAAGLYVRGGAANVAMAGIAVTVRDLLDSADGQLARAKKLYSRQGRFLDSIGDVVVNAAVFGAIGWMLAQTGESTLPYLAALIGFVGITLRVSYHVFYQTSYLHLEERYQNNRVTEEITESDLQGDIVALRLQRVFLALYGWQDHLMMRIDAWCRGPVTDEQRLRSWYSDALGLRLSGFLGFGTELSLLTVCSLFNEVWTYLLLNILLMNALLCCSILYRRLVLRRRVISSGGTSGAGDSA